MCVCVCVCVCVCLCCMHACVCGTGTDGWNGCGLRDGYGWVAWVWQGRLVLLAKNGTAGRVWLDRMGTVGQARYGWKGMAWPPRVRLGRTGMAFLTWSWFSCTRAHHPPSRSSAAA